MGWFREHCAEVLRETERTAHLSISREHVSSHNPEMHTDSYREIHGDSEKTGHNSSVETDPVNHISYPFGR
jgi:hypothetical protein